MHAQHIVPTGPESFVDELLTIDSDFFGGCTCEDCEAPEHLMEPDEDEPELLPVLVRR